MTTVAPLGGLATFNMQHGFVEALVRGFRSGFLTEETYHHITQCDNLEVNFFYHFFASLSNFYFIGFEIKSSRD